MKTIKQGRQQRGWAGEFICTGLGNGGGGCGATLLVEEGDLFHTTEVHQSDTDQHVAFRCHECHVITVTRSAPFAPMSLPTYGEWIQTHNFPLPPKSKALSHR